MIEAVGSLAGRLNAWIVAEGVERQEELDGLTRLRVPLAQGYYLSRPAPMWATLHPDLAIYLSRRRRRERDHATIECLIEHVPTTSVSASGNEYPLLVGVDGSADWIVALDEWSCPAQLLSRDVWTKVLGARPAIMRVQPTSRAGDVARRAMTRPPVTRFDPVLCTDEDGSHMGIVRMEHLIGALCNETTSAEPFAHIQAGSDEFRQVPRGSTGSNGF